MTDIFKKSFTLLLKRQTNILSAAYIIMATVILSQILGIFRERILVSIFGATNTLGIYNFALVLPDTIFQLTISSALASAFIPVFCDYLARNEEKYAHKMASILLSVGLCIFLLLSLLLAVFAPQILTMFNLGSNFSPDQMQLMVNLMRLVMVGQILFIIGTFFTALLQSYNRFFIPGIAAALYNLGIIIGILLFSSPLGIYSAPVGIIIGACIFIAFQIPTARKLGFHYTLSLDVMQNAGARKVLKLMWPRSLQNGVQQFGTVALAIIIGLMVDPGRMKLLFDYARTLMFAPVSLVGFSIAQAAFPMLSREKDNQEDFKTTFMSSFNQILYLILPISAIILVLRIPIVRLIFGADRFDWDATVLTGRTLAFFAISIFAQALIGLLYRAFYAIHDSKIPLVLSALSTLLLIILSYIFVVFYHLGIQSIAFAFSIANIVQMVLLMIVLDRKVGGFNKKRLFVDLSKFFVASAATAVALYIPIKLLDQLVFDTTRTINLLILTGISSVIGISIYVFLTWLFNIREASTYLLMFKRLGNWREVLNKSDEFIDSTRLNP